MKRILALLILLLPSIAMAQERAHFTLEGQSGPSTGYALYFQVRASAPQCFRVGQVYYDTGLSTSRICTVKGNPGTWVSHSTSGASAGGSDTQVQFNDGATFGADAGLTYNKTTDTLTGVHLVGSTDVKIGAGSVITSSGAGGALGALSFVTPGTGIANALGVNVGSAGAPVVNGGALGTPASGTATSLTGLPISTGLAGAGTGVLTALGVNVGSAGAPVLFNGALGTPSSGTLSSATGLPVATGISGMGTGVATALAINIGSAGAPVLFNGAGGTPSSLVGTNISGTAAGLTSGNVTTNANLTGDVTSLGNATAIASGVIVNADLNASAAIDATKIADGTVTSAEFQFINTLSSNAQTQLDAKQATLTNSAGLRGALSDENGTGAALFSGATSPTFVTPVLGAATATSINGNTFTTGTYTLTGTAGKTLTFNNSLTLAGTDGITMTTPSTSFTAARTDAGNTFTGVNTFTSPKIITDLSDTNGNELFKVTATGSAVNEFTVANAATAGNPVLSATGGDSNIGMTFTPKGTGGWLFKSGSATVLFEVKDSSNNLFFSIDQAASQIKFRSDIVDQNSAGGTYDVVVNSGRMIVGPTGSVEYRATSGGSIDTQLTRNAAGVLQFGTTSANAAGSFISTGATITGLASDAAQTDSTVCVNGSGVLFKGSGTLGICLGTSSARYKTGWHGLAPGLPQILALKPGQFHYLKGYGDGGARLQYGFKAEDVESVLPILVGKDIAGKPNSVDILGMVPVLIQAVQQTNARLNALEKENKRLRRLLHRRN